MDRHRLHNLLRPVLYILLLAQKKLMIISLRILLMEKIEKMLLLI